MSIAAKSSDGPDDDTVSIVGADCRLPGATGLHEFWQVLENGRDTVSEIPDSRFNARKWYSSEAGKPHSIRNLDGGFLDHIDQFDADFFGILPAEAHQMDPQQRLLLETSWRAVEDADATMSSLAGSNTGVYLSTFNTDYWDMLRSANHRGMHAVMGGASGGMSAGRVAYHLDLRGPSMSIESACATPLLSVHLAVRALRSGEIDLAIVGGANLLLTPDLYFALSEADMLSPTGRCRFGDQQADGYVRSEGVVVLVLKRTRDARRDGDRAYAEIMGTAARNDGRTGGTLTAPGLDGQLDLLAAAYRDAGADPADVDFVEAHGPGTPIGDPIELAALARVLGEGRDPARQCVVGSVKSNIGHLEGAAGFAGLLKAALALHHQAVPRTLHVQTPVAQFAEPGYPLRLATRTIPLETGERRALAGVSAFGLSGANAHVVLAESAPRPARPAPVTEPAAHLLALSAKNAADLRRLAGDTLAAITAPDAPPLIDVCHSMAVRRTHHQDRVALVGDKDEIAAGLRAIAGGSRQAGDTGSENPAPKVVFVFPGQGSQWPGMAVDLLRTDRTFAARLSECDAAVHAELGWSVISALTAGAELASVAQVQPVLWAVEVALAATWTAWGITPDLVIGHSMGEIAAAVTSGALTVAEGAAVICRRARLLAERHANGAMWAVQLGADELRPMLSAYAGRASVGVLNSPHATILSGEADALREIAASLDEAGVFCRQVQVDYASHCPSVAPLCPPIEEALTELTPQPGSVAMYSTVRDGLVEGTELDGAYWAANLLEPVRFADAIQAVLAEQGPLLFIEISPHPVLTSAIEDVIDARPEAATAVVTGSLRRDEPGPRCLLGGLATAYTFGCEPDWRRLTEGGRHVSVPGYPLAGESYWVSELSGLGPLLSVPTFSASRWVERAARPVPAEISPSLPGSPEDCAQELVRHAQALLGIAIENVDIDRSLTHLGVDSLFAGKIAYQLRADLGISLHLRELLQGQSIRAVGETIYQRLLARTGEPVWRAAAV